MLMNANSSYTKTKLQKACKRMRKVSGEVESLDILIDFIYILGRDHLPLGKIEGIMLQIEKSEREYTKFTNGFLARYAQDVAERLEKK